MCRSRRDVLTHRRTPVAVALLLAQAGLLATIATIGIACAPVRTALRPYQATPTGDLETRAASATPATAAAPHALHPSDSSRTIYLVASDEQAAVVGAALAQFGSPNVMNAIPDVIVLPDHAPFSPQPPGYVPPVSLTIVDVRP